MSPLYRTLAGLGAALMLVLSSVPVSAVAVANPSGPYVAPHLQERMARDPNGLLPVILQLRTARGPQNRAASSQAAEGALGLLRQHGRGGSAHAIISGASGRLSASAIQALAKNPNVAAIYEDAPIRRKAVGSDLKTAYPAEINAPAAWQQNMTGAGVAVAVLDSGINPDFDLSGRILTAVNFADPLTTTADPGGHGTHVAGIIAGNGKRSEGQYVGVAPRANLVDVRVLDAQGNGSASSVIAGLQWTISHAAQYGIRVVNLSLGATPLTDYIHDPVAAAAEVAWLSGLVVVTAAGNTGVAIDTPGVDPHVLTVGALDDQGTAPLLDDTLPAWTAWGTPIGSTAKPDIVAPGRRIVSIRSPGSTLDVLHPDRVVTASDGQTYFRLSGTSMATGVASGVVALLLQAHPELKPNQVKAILTGTAAPFGQSTGVSVPGPVAGAGNLNAQAAIQAPAVAPTNVGLRVADPAAEGLYALLNGQPLVWKDPTLNGIDWTQYTWANLVWSDAAWDNLAWDNFAWDTLAWSSLTWSNFAWDAIAWNDGAWDTFASPTADPD
jgi:serine protease AprX